MDLRKKIYSEQKEEEIHYRIKDQMVEILEDIIEFEKILNKMKQNLIVHYNEIKFNNFNKLR